jgi:hypothetical protein
MATSANAILELRITDGINTESISDTDDGILDGVVSFNGAIGDWNINFITGATNPAIGNQYADRLDLFSFNATSALPLPTDALTIMLSDTDFTRTATSYNVNVGGTTAGTVAFETYFGASNTTFDTGLELANLGTFGAGAFSDSKGGSISASGPYSITHVARITHSSFGDATSFNHEIVIPEPNALALLGIGMLGLGFLGRRSRTQ